MATTIDHLRRDHRITVLRAFTDAAGITMKPSDTGILREMAYDHAKKQILLDIEQQTGMVRLAFDVDRDVKEGPRIGHMKEFFALGDAVAEPGAPRPRIPGERTMIVPRQPTGTPADSGPDWWREALTLERAGRDEEAEQLIRQSVPHIGAGASIAELYAQRMRAFQRAGDEANAIVAFRKAVDWMGTYAGWATSGGEGAALSYERDRFHEALVREFGYDPTAPLT